LIIARNFLRSAHEPGEWLVRVGMTKRDQPSVIGFEAGGHRLSLGKARTGGRIDHRREDFSDQ
jgi:hypothetical protein